MAKNLLNKYAWLVETIYNSNGITLNELQEKWRENDLSMGEDLPRRTFHNWCTAAQEMFGVNIECDVRGGYRYYISNEEEIKKGGLRSWLLQTLSVSNMLMNNQTLKDRILLETVPSGQRFLTIILDAMRNNNMIKVSYHSFWKDEEKIYSLQPYCVKLFKQRWYLLAVNPYFEKPAPFVYALDRMIDVSPLTDEKFFVPTDFNATDFFDSFYGIIISPNKVEKVRLKVSSGQANYLRSLPLHKTQKEVERNDEYSIFELRIRPEFDFQQEILSQIPDVEVLEPTWLRDEIVEKVDEMWNTYKNNKK
ncbi:MAG: WYL domain-containing protein [Bacteroidales bacterium]|nr:WYL domain-containing protein [Bacteroidales bacterium]